jgi:hypothetical protein
LLIGLHSLIGRLRLIAGDEVLLAAEKVAESIVVSYSRPPTRFKDLYKLMRAGRVDPLKAFTVPRRANGYAQASIAVGLSHGLHEPPTRRVEIRVLAEIKGHNAGRPRR